MAIIHILAVLPIISKSIVSECQSVCPLFIQISDLSVEQVSKIKKSSNETVVCICCKNIHMSFTEATEPQEKEQTKRGDIWFGK